MNCSFTRRSQKFPPPPRRRGTLGRRRGAAGRAATGAAREGGEARRSRGHAATATARRGRWREGTRQLHGTLESIGITCALCHSVVDDSLAPGIGRRRDGWPNRKLNVGAIIALSPVLTEPSASCSPAGDPANSTHGSRSSTAHSASHSTPRRCPSSSRPRPGCGASASRRSPAMDRFRIGTTTSG